MYRGQVLETAPTGECGNATKPRVWGYDKKEPLSHEAHVLTYANAIRISTSTFAYNLSQGDDCDQPTDHTISTGFKWFESTASI